MTQVQVTWWIFALALFFLASGLGVFFWAVRKPVARYLYTTNHLVWALVAMTPTLLLFSLFPDSSAQGGFVGFTVAVRSPPSPRSGTSAAASARGASRPTRP
jgi:hypothetical protein